MAQPGLDGGFVERGNRAQEVVELAAGGADGGAEFALEVGVVGAWCVGFHGVPFIGENTTESFSCQGSLWVPRVGWGRKSKVSRFWFLVSGFGLGARRVGGKVAIIEAVFCCGFWGGI